MKNRVIAQYCYVKIEKNTEFSLFVGRFSAKMKKGRCVFLESSNLYLFVGLFD